MKHLAWWTTAVLLASGCFPYAYVVPPLDLGADVGLRAGQGETRTQVALNVATRPLALAESLHHRPVDFSLGYSLVLTPGPILHGPSAELTHFLVEIQTSPTFLWRLRAGVATRLFFDGVNPGFGTQAVARFVFEGATFESRSVSGNSYSGANFGYAHGELGFGLYTETGALVMPTGAPQWAVSYTLTTGLMFTLPAGAGVGFLWWR